MTWHATSRVFAAISLGYWRVCQCIGLGIGAVVYLGLAAAGVVR